MQDSNIVNIRFSRDELTNLDTLVTRGGYKSRSAYIKYLIAEQMQGIPSDNTRAAVLDILTNEESARDAITDIVVSAMSRVINSLLQGTQK